MSKLGKWFAALALLVTLAFGGGKPSRAEKAAEKGPRRPEKKENQKEKALEKKKQQ